MRNIIRKIEINNFRSLEKFEWQPHLGINCLVGSGDSGKSTILDAIDFCIGARRNLQITDADFYNLDVSRPVTISIALGNLDDSLKNFDAYGFYLRGFNTETGTIEDEPGNDLETILTLKLTIEDDLEPRWELVSKRAEAQNQSRSIKWSDRVMIAPSRLGALDNYNLSWRHGSILNKISEERADASAVLAKAVREARISFGEGAKRQLSKTLEAVADTAKKLGIPIGNEVRAMLDTQIASFNGGTISLHDYNGIPLKGLGLGSARLLIAGIQRLVAEQASIILIDELEYGLEPHRIIRLLDALGAKDESPPLQVFMTTHSPVAIRELSADQLFVIRPMDGHHKVLALGSFREVQGTIRRYPDALLAPSIIVCEGASEVGLLRGIDQYRFGKGEQSIAAYGVAVVDGGGTEAFKRAINFISLGYRTCVLKDSDVSSPADLEASFRSAGGKIIAWRDGRALEDELFLSLGTEGLDSLISLAIELKGEEIVNEQIKSASNNAYDLEGIRGNFSQEIRAVLAKAAKSKKNGWFKTVSDMEAVARDIVGPDLPNTDEGFRTIINNIFEWISYARQRD